MKNKRIIGYAYVVGDILHFGHIQHLKNCKALCDKLIVGVLTDEACMEKKPKPSIRFKERMEIIAELKSVDAAIVQDTYSPFNNVINTKPNILFESSSHDKIMSREGLKVIIMPYFPDQSSTKIKEVIRGNS